MHLLNAAVAVGAALVGTVGATVAYGTMNTTPSYHTEPVVEPVTITEYLPCEPPSKLTDGVCVTTVVKTVVKTAEPKVITVESRSPSKGKGGSSGKAAARDSDDDDDDHEDDHEDEDDHDEDEDDHEDEDD